VQDAMNQRVSDVAELKEISCVRDMHAVELVLHTQIFGTVIGEIPHVLVKVFEVFPYTSRFVR
jgi:hypothetical protein